VSNVDITSKATRTLEIKHNNCGTNDPCAICGARTDPVVGPEVFLAGSWALVCRYCTAEEDNELCRIHSAMYRCGEIAHGAPLVEAHGQLVDHVRGLLRELSRLELSELDELQLRVLQNALAPLRSTVLATGCVDFGGDEIPF
jgi:hypothetical protein